MRILPRESLFRVPSVTVRLQTDASVEATTGEATPENLDAAEDGAFRRLR
jgi:hypothetical protein